MTDNEDKKREKIDREDKKREKIDRWEKLDHVDITTLSERVAYRNGQMSLKAEFIASIEPSCDDIEIACSILKIPIDSYSDELGNVIDTSSRIAFSNDPFEVVIEVKRLNSLFRSIGQTCHLSRNLLNR
jgi:hypothetical protein